MTCSQFHMVKSNNVEEKRNQNPRGGGVGVGMHVSTVVNAAKHTFVTQQNRENFLEEDDFTDGQDKTQTITSFHYLFVLQ